MKTFLGNGVVEVNFALSRSATLVETVAKPQNFLNFKPILLNWLQVDVNYSFLPVGTVSFIAQSRSNLAKNVNCVNRYFSFFLALLPMTSIIFIISAHSTDRASTFQTVFSTVSCSQLSLTRKIWRLLNESLMSVDKVQKLSNSSTEKSSYSRSSTACKQ